MTSLRKRMTEEFMQVRNLALNTQMSYVQQVSLFARHFSKSPGPAGSGGYPMGHRWVCSDGGCRNDYGSHG